MSETQLKTSLSQSGDEVVIEDNEDKRSLAPKKVDSSPPFGDRNSGRWQRYKVVHCRPVLVQAIAFLNNLEKRENPRHHSVTV